MSPLPKCHLCDDLSDPRMSVVGTNGDVFPLCDGCSPDDNQTDIARVYDQCTKAGPAPDSLFRPRFGFEACTAKVQAK